MSPVIIFQNGKAMVVLYMGIGSILFASGCVRKLSRENMEQFVRLFLHCKQNESLCAGRGLRLNGQENKTRTDCTRVDVTLDGMYYS